jgi:uncharacterized protein (DUF2235 family)
MPPKPKPSRNVLHLRLDPAVQERLQAEADRRHRTLSNEIRIRLLDSFDRDVKFDFKDLLDDMQICWLRFSARFLRMQLADELVDAVLANATPDHLRGLAQLIVRHRADEQRTPKLGGGAS